MGRVIDGTSPKSGVVGGIKGAKGEGTSSAGSGCTVGSSGIGGMPLPMSSWIESILRWSKVVELVLELVLSGEPVEVAMLLTVLGGFRNEIDGAIGVPSLSLELGELVEELGGVVGGSLEVVLEVGVGFVTLGGTPCPVSRPRALAFSTKGAGDSLANLGVAVAI